MRYQVIIDPVDATKSGIVMIENVLNYRHEGSGVFKFSGNDFDQWLVLLPGQSVQVTAQDETK